MRTRVLAALFILATLPAGPAAAEPHRAAPSVSALAVPSKSAQGVWKEILSNRTVQVTRVDSIPTGVLRLDILTDRGNGRMANPGEDWNAGCVQDGKVPGAQLVFAARTPHGWLVHSLRGGFITSQQLVFVWDAAGSGPVFRIDRPVPAHAEHGPRRTVAWPASLEELQHDLRPEWIIADRSATPAR